MFLTSINKWVGRKINESSVTCSRASWVSLIHSVPSPQVAHLARPVLQPSGLSPLPQKAGACAAGWVPEAAQVNGLSVSRNTRINHPILSGGIPGYPGGFCKRAESNQQDVWLNHNPRDRNKSGKRLTSYSRKSEALSLACGRLPEKLLKIKATGILSLEILI